MAAKTALGYVLDDDGKLIDAFIQCNTAADPAPTAVELEIVRIVKENRELRSELDRMKDENDKLISLAAIYQRVKMIYENSVDITSEPVKTAVQVLLGEGEAGIRRQMEQNRQEYIRNLQAELKVKNEEIDRLQPFERFYRHIEQHLTPGEKVICKICGKSLDDIEQAAPMAQAASERDNNH